jgi:hypothetical protein
MEDKTMRVYLLACSVVAFASPALAAEFYLVQNAADKTCTIETKKPDGTTMVMIGTSGYASKEEAKAAKKAAIDAGQCAAPPPEKD